MPWAKERESNLIPRLLTISAGEKKLPTVLTEKVCFHRVFMLNLINLINSVSSGLILFADNNFLTPSQWVFNLSKD